MTAHITALPRGQCGYRLRRGSLLGSGRRWLGSTLTRGQHEDSCPPYPLSRAALPTVEPSCSMSPSSSTPSFLPLAGHASCPPLPKNSGALNWGTRGTWQGGELWFCCDIASCLPTAPLLPGEALGTLAWPENKCSEDGDMQDPASQGHGIDCASYGSFIAET